MVDEFRGDESHTYDNRPLYEVHPVSLLVSDTTCRLIDMRLEESHHRGNEVPCQIDGSKETDCLHCDIVREQHLDIIQQTRFLLTTLLPFRKLRTLLQLSLQVPCNECHDEERQEHQAGTEGIDSRLLHISTTNGMSYTLHPSEQITTRCEKHSQQQDDHRTDAP